MHSQRCFYLAASLLVRSLHLHLSASHPHFPFFFPFFTCILLFFSSVFCSSSSFAVINLAHNDSSAGASAAGQVISDHLSLLHQMLQTLLQAGRGREAEAMAHTLVFVGGLLPSALQQGISRRALEGCQNADAQARANDILLHTVSFLQDMVLPMWYLCVGTCQNQCLIMGIAHTHACCSMLSDSEELPCLNKLLSSTETISQSLYIFCL